MQAAVEAARALPFPFTLTARAENFLHGRKDLDDTIKRLQAFEAVGADVLYSPGLYDIDTIRTVVSSIGKPFNLVMGFADPTLTRRSTLESRRQAHQRRRRDGALRACGVLENAPAR